MADIDTDALTGGAEGAKSVGYVNIDLSGVCLAGNNEGGVEPGLFGNKLI
jgi:hypothetical protein